MADLPDAAEPHPFEPDWTLSPGTLIREVLEDRGLTLAEFAEQTGLDETGITGILAATIAIDADKAERIGKAIGTSAQMWLNAERIYREALARGATDSSWGDRPLDIGPDGPSCAS